jgi:hypothetical protein
VSFRDERRSLDLGEGHNAEVGDLAVNGPIRLRVVQVLDGGIVVVRRPRWYDGILRLMYVFAKHYREAEQRELEDRARDSTSPDARRGP